MVNVRTVKASSGPRAVQIMWSTRRGHARSHPGSAHDDAGIAALEAAAAQRLVAGQAQLDLGLTARSQSEPLPITSSMAAQLWDELCAAYELLGSDEAADGGAFRQTGARTDHRADEQGHSGSSGSSGPGFS